MSDLPIAYFAFNRPECVEMTLSNLMNNTKANKSVLHIFVDGPRNKSDEIDIKDTLKVIKTLDLESYFHKVKIIKRQKNLGLKESVKSGVSSILQTYDRVIVFEDDHLVHKKTIDYMSNCLNFFEPKKNIGAITASCPIKKVPENYSKDFFASYRNCSHVWGTWADRWSLVNWTPNKKRPFLDEKAKKIFLSSGRDRVNRLKNALKGSSKSWSIIFGLSMANSRLLTVYPTFNLVQNIGFGKNATNTVSGDGSNNSIEFKNYSLHEPEFSDSLNKELIKVYNRNIFHKILRYIKN